jgi:predicted ATPase
VTGPGGTGKSRLALQVAAELVGDANGRRLLVPLADLSDSDLVVPTIAQALGARRSPYPASTETHSCCSTTPSTCYLPHRRSPELLARAPRCACSSRAVAPLRVSGEREYPLEPLPDADAIELFVERARAVGREVQPSGSVAAICRRLDGLPLAVELAAARTKLLDPESLLQRLERASPPAHRRPEGRP